MKRKILKILGWTMAVGCGLFILAVLMVDFWAPSIIRPLLKEQGVTFGQVTRDDGHYMLTDVNYVGEGLEANVVSLYIPTPWRVISKKWLWNESEATVFVRVITVEQHSTSIAVEEQESGEPMDLPQMAETYVGYWEEAFNWIDFVQLEKISYSNDGEVLVNQVDVTVDPEELNVIHYLSPDEDALDQTETPYRADVLAVRRVSATQLNVMLDSVDYGVTMESDLQLGSDLELSGALAYKSSDGELQFTGIWGPEGYSPSSAHAETNDFILPVDVAELPGYQQPSINLKADWDGAKVSINLDVRAQAIQPDLPPLMVTLQALGDVEVINVEQLNAEAWSSKIALSKPLRVEVNNLQDLPDAELTVDLNLSDIPDENLDGRLQGAVVVDHQPGAGWPLITANFTGQSLRYEAYELAQLDFQAQLDYPKLTLDALNASMQGATLNMTAQADVEARTIAESKLELKANGALLETLKPLIGEQEITFAELNISASASGPLVTPAHEGNLAITGLRMGQGVEAQADANWKADWLEFSELALHLRNARSGVELKASASLGGLDRSVAVESMRLDVREQPELELEQPFTLTMSESGVLGITPLTMFSDGGGMVSLSAQIDYPTRGRAQLEARDVKAVWLDLVLDEPLPYDIRMDELALQTLWDDGPLEATLKLDAGLHTEGQPEVELIADLTLIDGQLNLPALSIKQGTFVLLNARGDLPLSVTPNGERLIVFSDAAPLDFELLASPDDSPLWNQFESNIAIDFIKPVIDFKVSGDVKSPAGQLDIQFDTVKSLDETAVQLPDVENAKVSVTLAPDLISMPTGLVSIAGHQLRIHGSSPMDDAAWLALINGTPPDWKLAEAGVEFKEVPLSAFAQWLPDVLRDDGNFSLVATLKPGENIRGSLDLNGVATRPLAQLGSLNEVQAHLRMEGKTLRVEKAEAMVGGSPLLVTGSVTLDDAWKPSYDLRLKGDNVPLARSPGIILRASPDITLKTDSEGVTTQGGVVTFNESFFTMDIASFQQGSGGGASRGGATNYPPYFSIEEEPLSDWRLNLKIEGDRFLRVRIPAFEGVVSANFDLRGTLENPRMFGAAELQRGVILFPFATLRLDQGTVSISQNEPEIPRLNITASGRAYGYDLQMRVSGTANEPVVSFTSTPSLEQSDIILMVTSGAIPEHARSTESRLSGIGLYIGRSFLVDLGFIDPLDDTLTVNIGEDVTASGKDTINIRYKINDDWDVVGAYDKYDSYYLDFEWTVYED